MMSRKWSQLSRHMAPKCFKQLQNCFSQYVTEEDADSILLGAPTLTKEVSINIKKVNHKPFMFSKTFHFFSSCIEISIIHGY